MSRVRIAAPQPPRPCLPMHVSGSMSVRRATRSSRPWRGIAACTARMAPSSAHQSNKARHVVLGAAPNNSFKPNLLRSTKAMAEKACHGFGSTTQVGLTQALGRTGCAPSCVAQQVPSDSSWPARRVASFGIAPSSTSQRSSTAACRLRRSRSIAGFGHTQSRASGPDPGADAPLQPEILASPSQGVVVSQPGG